MSATHYRREPYDRRTKKEAEDEAVGVKIDGTRYSPSEGTEDIDKLRQYLVDAQTALGQGLTDVADHLFRIRQRVAAEGPSIEGRDVALALQFFCQSRDVLAALYKMHLMVLANAHGAWGAAQGPGKVAFLGVSCGDTPEVR